MPLARTRSKSGEKTRTSIDGQPTQDAPPPSTSVPGGTAENESLLDGEPGSSDRQITFNHPLGRILLRLAANRGASKTDELEQLCQDFVQVLTLQQQDSEITILETSNKLEETLKSKIEEDLTKKELSHYQVGELISPPKYFAPDKTLHQPGKLELASKYFPLKTSSKFDGTERSMSIMEFLSTINLAQDVCKLSEDEFKCYLLRATSGKVFNSLSQYIKYGYSVSDIYSTLLLLFDTRDSSQVCKQKLLKFKVASNETLTTAVSKIMELSTRAAQALPEGPSRSALFNLEACSCLLRALPYESSTLATTIHNSLASKLDRAPQFLELVKALNKHVDTINKDIYNHGHPPLKAGPKGHNNSSKHKETAHKEAAQMNFLGQKPPSGKHFPKRNSKANSKSTPRSNSTQSKYCSLCGKNNHRASDICFSMKDDKGRVVQCVPSYTSCGICESKSNVKLYHPENLCPNRNRPNIQ